MLVWHLRRKISHQKPCDCRTFYQAHQYQAQPHGVALLRYCSKIYRSLRSTEVPSHFYASIWVPRQDVPCLFCDWLYITMLIVNPTSVRRSQRMGGRRPHQFIWKLILQQSQMVSWLWAKCRRVCRQLPNPLSTYRQVRCSCVRGEAWVWVWATLRTRNAYKKMKSWSSPLNQND